MASKRKTAESVPVGHRLKAVRTEQGLRQQDVAARIEGMSVGNYGHYETGEHTIEMTEVPMLATALGVEPGELAARLVGQPLRLLPGQSVGEDIDDPQHRDSTHG